jgi:hypothetical protein
VEKNVANLKAKMEICRRHVEANYEIDSLSSSFPRRLGKLLSKKGDRLNH